VYTQKEFFHEFVTRAPNNVQKALAALANKGILGGLPLKDNTILWCVTELNTKEEINTLADTLAEISKGAAL
jgi:glycine dehydrogenase subunit 1